MHRHAPRPNFFIIGAQKSGTTWLWQCLQAHPGTSLGRKEIHYYGGAEHYRKGPEWYYRHFSSLDSTKLIGEASTSYLYDRAPYFYNAGRRIEHDASLPSIPELILRDHPDARFIAILRDPVRRALSAYRHWMKRQYRTRDAVSPVRGLTYAALERPKFRILEYGYYEQHLAVWQRHVPAERLKILIFEEDILAHPEWAWQEVCAFLNLDPDYVPPLLRKQVHASTSLTRSWLTSTQILWCAAC